MPNTTLVGRLDQALNQAAGGTFARAVAPGMGEFVVVTTADVSGLDAALTAKAADNAVVKLTGTQTVAGVKTFLAPVATPMVDHGTQGGTLLAPTPQTLWQQQPRDPQFGPWHCHSGGQYFGADWDPVLYFGYNSHFAPNHNPDEPSCTLNHEVNYFEAATGKTTFEAYNEFLSADQSIRVRPWAFTLDKATGSTRFTIDVGPANDYGFFTVNSGNTVLFKVDGGGISPDADDTVATLSWSSLETFNYTANSLGSTLALKGVTAKLHLDNAAGIVQWDERWQNYISGGNTNLYLYDMTNARFHVTHTGAATSADATTTFNARVISAGGFSGPGAGLTGITQANVTGLDAALALKAPIAAPIFTGVETVASSGADGTFAEVLRFQLPGNTGTGNWRHSFQSSLSSAPANNILRIMIGTSQTTQTEVMRWVGTGAVSIPGTLTATGGFSGPGTLLTGITQSQITGLTAALASKADDSAVVHKTGAETIAGTKTFTGGITSPRGTTAQSIEAFGANALSAITSGINSVAVGGSALAALTTGTNNTAFGHAALASSVSGSSNTAIGYAADVGKTTGNQCTAIGASTSTGAFTKSTAIGNGATNTVDNQVMIGTATEKVTVPGPAEFLSTTTTFGPTGTLNLTDTGGGNFRIIGNAITALDQATLYVRNAAATTTFASIDSGSAIFRVPMNFYALTSTLSDQPQGRIATTWADSTHASRKGRMSIFASDWTGIDKEVIRVESDGINPRVSLYGRVGFGVTNQTTRLEIPNGEYLGFQLAAGTGVALFMRADPSNGGAIHTSSYATPMAIDASSVNLNLVSGAPTVLGGPLVLPAMADAAIPNGGIAWSTDTPGVLKVRTPSGTLKTLAFEP